MDIAHATPTEVLTEALALAHDDRAMIAQCLLRSLEEDEEISSEWREELERRRAAWRKGEIRGFSRDEAFRAARAGLKGDRA